MDTCKNTLIKTADTLHLTMSEIQRFSYMLMINTDVQAFVMQNTIAQGSADIQILINAQRQLSYVKSVHPAIDSLYLYSKKSDYLLEADNAFFDIDTMYTALFTFQDLNSRQWREYYLRPVYVNAWLPESSVISKGIRRKLLVFEQTFPLQNTAANEGKLIILLKTSYFEGLFSALPASTKAVFWLIDSKGRPLLIRPDGAVKETEPVQSEIQTMLSAMPKPMQTLFSLCATDTGYRYCPSCKHSAIHICSTHSNRNRTFCRIRCVDDFSLILYRIYSRIIAPRTAKKSFASLSLHISGISNRSAQRQRTCGIGRCISRKRYNPYKAYCRIYRTILCKSAFKSFSNGAGFRDDGKFSILFFSYQNAKKFCPLFGK